MSPELSPPTEPEQASPITFLQAINRALHDEMARDDNVILFGEDVAELGGAFKATEGLLAKFGRDRVVDTPISESLIVGAGVGAAVVGLRPVVEMQFIDFISCGFDMIVNMAATLRYRHGGRARVPLVIRGPSGAGVHGGLFHSQNPEAWFLTVPGLKVVYPSTARDAYGLLRSAIRDDDPVIFLEHKRLYRSVKEVVPASPGDVPMPLGKAATRRQGRDVCIVSYGGTMPLVLEAAEKLSERHGVECEVIDLRTLFPLDWPLVFESVGRVNKVMVVHEARGRCGLGAEIAYQIQSQLFEALDGPIVRVASVDTHNAFAAPLESWILPSVDKIVEQARTLAEY